MQVPYDLGPFASAEEANLECRRLRALGATCEVVEHHDAFWCRVTKEPD